MHTDFLNKNMYRKYPLRATSSHIFIDGTELSQKLLTSAQISTIYGFHDLYISKIFGRDGFLSITVRDAITGKAVGVFNGTIVSDYQILPLTPFFSYVSGSITVGQVDDANFPNGSHYFTPENGRFEGSTIFCFQRPRVTSILNKMDSAVGKITVATKNITVLESIPNIDLSITNTKLILSHNDTSGSLDNCGVPLIQHINDVPPNSNSNIDIFGILPIVIDVHTGTNIIGISTGDMTMDVLCPKKLSPPANYSDEYYANILTVTVPEWKTWPYYRVPRFDKPGP